MNRTEFLAWLVAPTGEVALKIWQAAHPEKLIYWYTFDPQIKSYWKSLIGQLNRAIIFLFQDLQRLLNKCELELTQWTSRRRLKKLSCTK